MSRFSLKMIAVLSMLTDHVGALFFDDIILLRIIGRLAFPIYCFFLVEGFCHTRNLHKYMIRLGVFAIISEIPFDMAFNDAIIEFGSQNVFFTLLIGVTVLKAIQESESINKKIIAIVLGSIVANIVRSDYMFVGICIISVMYIWRDNFYIKTLLIMPINLIINYIQGYAIVAMIPIFLYNGRKGPDFKYFFYAFYPVHLLVLYLIKATVS